MNDNLHINSKRLQTWLADFATIGGTPNGGVHRLTLTDLDKQARDLFVSLAKKAGCSIKIDAMGNIFARRPGEDNLLSPVLIGSHIDSQPLGGKYDGIYGVLAALEVVYSLNDHNIKTDRPIDVVSWTNEEGSRFAPAMIGSAVFSGLTTLQDGWSCRDSEGNTIKQELERIGYAGNDNFSNYKIHASLELHIEQGPILENQNELIGIVTGALGQKWYDVEFTGMASHAGTTPMEVRQDALLGLAEAVLEVNTIGKNEKPEGRATVGMVKITPNSRNVISDKAWFSVEFRHPSEKGLQRMDQQLSEKVHQIAEKLNLTYSIRPILSFPPLPFDKTCIEVVRKVAQNLNYPHRTMVSGAGHDSCNISKIAPTSMIFIPCIKGISHNEKEEIRPEWMSAGANVLLNAVKHLSKR
ncbi:MULTISPECIES: M20 family metallo-hydrolase [unclassified Apibacter]|uniref:M20 family metallo-hydrolase n=1 Tax=unclassified Apibacter TaxID=2630820 RepID=UPI001327692B|nr:MULTISPECIES: M20 family metallo-hydrolase [unclassified Apibacter]MCX8677149.1 M20 family metallo-hydrolase [Apibacter sp. B3919]MXO24471.1 hydantoinase/carbamoylase family amidase [Apibacter sp. B3924]MXO25715.1 hydantoinase/carbamoylase family amidase [Apibacter sp. B3813]MXO27666.1 hydantoinase/carbamoylase family amidase [Apibacter sp. B3913]MXO29974.1 hydantoinase/carbamoylase family amidase [Apibacter sp. B3912]